MQILNRYKKVAYLSYHLIIHFKHVQVDQDKIVLLMDVKHILDLKYQPIILTTSKGILFEISCKSAFLHIFENFLKYGEYAKTSTSTKPKHKVSFYDIVKVRPILDEQCTDYCHYLKT